MKWVQRIGQWMLALVFAVAAGLKLAWLAGRGGGGTGAQAQTLFSALPLWGRWGLVILEMLLALWLASNWRPRLGAFVTIVTLSAFLAVVLVEMGKPTPRDCGCLGNAGGTLQLGWTLALDGVMLAVALGIYFASSGPRTASQAGIS